MAGVSYQHFSRLVSIGVCRVHLCFVALVFMCMYVISWRCVRELRAMRRKRFLSSFNF